MEKKENGNIEKNTENGTMEIEKAVEKVEPKINYRGWKAMPLIIGNEAFEKLGAIGTLANLLIYLTSVFNLKRITAANIINVFSGTANFGTMVGAYLCDTYFGRYKTLGFATVTSFLGLQVIQLTAAISKLHPKHCGAESSTCKGPTSGQMAVLFVGLGLMIIGAGGVRPCNLAFGADQFNPGTESGKRGINSFFNWYYCTFTFAQMVSLTLIVYVQANVSWTIGLAIPALLMLIACGLFFGGSKIYVKVKATGSPMTSVAQVIVVAIKKRRLKQPDQPQLSLFNHMPPSSINSKLPYTDQFRCIDKAAIITPEDQINPDGSPANPWRLCSLQQVEELKCILRVIPIWAAAVIYHVVIVQQQTYAVFQAQQTDRRLGNSNFKVPAASYTVFLMLSSTLWIPIYDRIIVPSLQKFTGREGGITLLQRISIGFVLSIITMLVSGFVEDRRRTIALTRPTVGIEPRRGAISAMSGMFLVPQLVLAGLCEAFSAIGQIEFYYKQFPENMRSIAGSLFYCGLAGSSYLSSVLITVVHQTTEKSATGNWLPEDLNKGRLAYFYYMIAALEVLNLIYFLVCARWYHYKGTGCDAVEANVDTKPFDKTPV